MAIATDRLHTIVTLDARDYERNADRVADATKKMKAAGLNPNLFKGMDKLFDPTRILEGALKAAGVGILAVSAAIVGLGVSSVRAYADMERLALGLNAVEGSAEVAAQRMKELRELAKAPGLGFTEAVSAYGMLRNAGASAGFSQEIIKQFANANARGGGDSETFSRILMAVAQALNAPFLQGDELRQLRENRVPVDAALRSKFGTSNTEELNKQGVTAVMAIAAITEEFSKMERVQGGFTTGMENLTDQLRIAQAAIGQGIAPVLLDFANMLGDAVGKLEESGVLKFFGQELGRIGQDIADAFAGITGGADGLALTFIELGGHMIDFGTVLRNLIEAYRPEKIGSFIDKIPGSPIMFGLDKLVWKLIGDQLGGAAGEMSEGAGGAFVDEAKRRLSDFQSGRNVNKGIDVGKWSESVADAVATNPVHQRQLMAQEQIARNTAELVRFEQTALGGGELLRRGISVSDANRYNSGGGSSSNAESNLVGAIKAMIAQNVARGL